MHLVQAAPPVAPRLYEEYERDLLDGFRRFLLGFFGILALGWAFVSGFGNFVESSIRITPWHSLELPTSLHRSWGLVFLALHGWVAWLVYRRRVRLCTASETEPYTLAAITVLSVLIGGLLTWLGIWLGCWLALGLTVATLVVLYRNWAWQDEGDLIWAVTLISASFGVWAGFATGALFLLVGSATIMVMAALQSRA